MTESHSPTLSERKQPKSFRRNSKTSQVVSVEIGYGVLRLLLLKKEGNGRFLLKKYHSVEFNKTLDQSSASFTAMLKSELKQFCSSCKDAEIWTMPQLDQANIVSIKIPRVSPARLPGAVYWALQSKESFLENETIIDFQVDRESSTGATLDISCALADRSRVESIQQTFLEAGFPLAGIGIPLFSLRNLTNLLRNGEPDAPVLICQMGEKATSVSVLQEGRIVFSRNIPLGLQSLVDTLIKELDPPPSPEEACHLTLKPGINEGLSPEAAQQQDLVPGLILPVLERLVRQIERTIELYQTNFDTEPLEVTFLGGELAARSHFFSFISKRLSSKVIVLDPFEVPELQNQENAPQERVDRIGYGPACGLALEAIEANINLVHTFKDRQNDAKLVKISTAVTFVLALLTALTAFIYNAKWRELRELESDQDNFKTELSSLGPPLTEATITQASAEIRIIQERRRATTRRYEGLAMLSEISQITPKNISLLHISTGSENAVEPASNRRSSKKPQNTTNETGTIVVKGVVNGERTDLETAITIYVARLDSSQLFKKVEVVSTKLVRESGSTSLTFTLNVQTLGERHEVITKK